MKPEKPIMWVINLLLSAFFAFGILAFMEQLLRGGWGWYVRSLQCWPVLICFLLGLLGRHVPRLKYVLLPAGCLISLVLMVILFGSYGFLDILYLMIALAVSAAMYFLGLRGEEAFPSRVAIASIIVYVVACVYFALGDYRLQDYEPLCWCALAAFILSMYSFNAASLYTGVHNAKGGETMAIPSGIRGKNLLLLTGFLVVAMLIGNLGVLHRILSGGWQWVMHGIAMFINFLANLQGGDDSGPAVAATPIPTAEPNNFDITQIGEDGSGIFVTVYGIILFIMAVLFFLLAYGFAKEGRKGGGLRRLTSALRNMFKTRQILEYEDDVERLTDLKTLLKERRQKLRKRIEKMRTRPQRMEDMPNDRMRVRFAYKSLLKSRRVGGWTPSATPAEVGAALETESLRLLTEHYNAARYDLEREVPPEFAQQAREALRDMGKR